MKKVRVLLVSLCLLTAGVQAFAKEGNELNKATSTQLRVKETSIRIKQNKKDAQAYAERAAARLEAGDAFAAIRDYNTALSLAPANVTFLQARGEAFLQVSAFKEALVDFNSAYAAAPSTALLYQRAMAEYYIEDYQAALLDLDKVISAEPAFTKALYNRAIVKIELNKTQEAIQDLDTLLAQEPNHLEALYTRSLAQGHLGKFSKK